MKGVRLELMFKLRPQVFWGVSWHTGRSLCQSLLLTHSIRTDEDMGYCVGVCVWGDLLGGLRVWFFRLLPVGLPAELFFWKLLCVTIPHLKVL